jgi:adenosyl cobinamide kinase/adenosyl cobinamide phosphate guanylyltransferase
MPRTCLPAGAPVCYVATARVDPDDDEWTARIDTHRSRRPPNWETVETTDIAGILPRRSRSAGPGGRPGHLDVGGPRRRERLGGRGAAPVVFRQVVELVESVAMSSSRVVLVSAEVGLGVVPGTRAGRLFRDELGALNTALASVCDEVMLLVAGLPLRLK